MTNLYLPPSAFFRGLYLAPAPAALFEFANLASRSLHPVDHFYDAQRVASALPTHNVSNSRM
jgi:hypothetical protein